MSNSTSLSDTLSGFTVATEAATQGLPEPATLLPPKDGITLLDTKNEIFLAYLQALALRNLHVIRSLKDGSDSTDAQSLSDEITRKLVEHRVYLERGVRPLEAKIKYQVDKVIRAADDAQRAETQTSKAGKAANGNTKADDKDGSHEEGSSEDDEDEDDIDAEAYRPNPASFAQNTTSADSAADANAARRKKSKEDGVYRPPRISATSMPTTETKEKKQREERPERSRTLDEYISQELSGAPMAQPSIGSTITAGGRKTKSDKAMREEAERTAYEETNLVRLPKESKKERAKKAAKERNGGSGFGGEEWRGLGENIDRIGDLTRRKSKVSALDNSRKRSFVEDGPRGSGVGDAFETKRRRMEKKAGRR